MSTLQRKPKKDKPVIAKKGLVIAYIGDGKGKTGAAMGLAVRAAGSGMDVCILQFVKSKKPEGRNLQPGEWPLSNEIVFFDGISGSGKIGCIDTEQLGEGFVGILGDKKDRDVHIREALRGLESARQLILSGKYQLIILDEIISALELNLLTEQDIVELIKIKPEMLHLCMTGHKKFKKIIAACDLVTEMKMIKHPYYEGVLAQRGIDY